ncbi:MAG: hypothetical protein SVU69_08005 [Pseudomonadota bacterium]|nr:hypothetical protein [Pseudomonadota bacterium]
MESVLKTTLIATSLFALPLAAHAELRPMADAELKAVTGQASFSIGGGFGGGYGYAYEGAFGTFGGGTNVEFFTFEKSLETEFAIPPVLIDILEAILD